MSSDSERQIEMFPSESTSDAAVLAAVELTASTSAVPVAPGARQSAEDIPFADPARLPVRALRVWPGNPRKHIDPADVGTLAESVRSSPRGVEMPLAVRPLATPEGEATHDVIDGQMRLLAAREVGLATVPVVVVAVDDAEALEMALRHNHARRDASPLDDAEAIERLLAYGRTVEQVARRMGARTVRWVDRRRSLLRLVLEARAWLAAGLPLGHAETLAALDPQAQAAVVARFSTGTGWRDPGTAAAWARELTYALQLLSTAPWELADATMPGGACTGCPRRSDAQADLFGGASEGAHCLDTACWSAKRGEHWARAVKTAKRRKILVVQGPCVDAWSKRGTEETYATLAEVPKGVEVKPTALGRDQHGGVYDLIRREDLRAAVAVAQRAAQEAQEADEGDEAEVSAPATKSPRQLAQEAEREARQARERQWARRLVDLVSRPPWSDVLAPLALAQLVTEYDCADVLRAAGVPDASSYTRSTEALATAESVPAAQRLPVLLAALLWIRLDPDADRAELTPAERELVALLDAPEPAAPAAPPTEAPAGPAQPPPLTAVRVWVAESDWDRLDHAEQEDFSEPIGGCPVAWEGREGYVTAAVSDYAVLVCLRGQAGELGIVLHEGDAPPAPT